MKALARDEAVRYSADMNDAIADSDSDESSDVLDMSNSSSGDVWSDGSGSIDGSCNDGASSSNMDAILKLYDKASDGSELF